MKKNKFLRHDHGDIFLTAYKAKFNTLSHYMLQLITSKDEIIRYSMKGLNTGL